MVTLKHLFGVNCLSGIVGPCAYQSCNIHRLVYKIIKVPRGWVLRAHCYINMQNDVSQRLYGVHIDTHPRSNPSFRRLTIHQGYLTKKYKKNIREGPLRFIRYGKVCPKYLPRSVSVFVTHNKHSTFHCLINVRVIVAVCSGNAYFDVKAHCLDKFRVIRITYG